MYFVNYQTPKFTLKAKNDEMEILQQKCRKNCMIHKFKVSGRVDQNQFYLNHFMIQRCNGLKYGSTVKNMILLLKQESNSIDLRMEIL